MWLGQSSICRANVDDGWGTNQTRRWITNCQYAVILVWSTSHAMRVERILERAGITCRLIPVPRHLSSDCGVCARIDRADAETARLLVEQAGVEIEGLHPV